MNNEEGMELQLELPDYSLQYAKWLEKQEIKKEENTVIVIDLY